MKKDESRQLATGVYRVFWKEECGGGMSVSALGMNENGDRWLAPANWLGYDLRNPGRCLWAAIDRVELIEARSDDKERA